MSDIVRTSKEVNIAEGDFAKKLREALGQDEPRGGELAVRRETNALGEGIHWPDVPRGVSVEVNVVPSIPGKFLTLEELDDLARQR